jgi:ABC-2 type transport system permease protein
MLNLVKMDFYRLLHSKAIKVGIVISTIIAFVGMLLNLGILELIKIAEKETPGSAQEMAILFPIVAWLNGVDFADVIFLGSNTLSLFVGCMVVASFMGSEQSCGYVKNIAGQLPNRGTMIVSKYIVTCAVHLIILLVYTIISSLCAILFFSSYIKAYSIGQLIAGLALRFLLFCAINAILVFFCTLTKSNAISLVIGAILGIGVMSLVYLAMTGLLSLVHITINVADYMPDGINGLISVSQIGNNAVHAIVVAIIFIAVFVTGAVMLFKKRDVK